MFSDIPRDSSKLRQFVSFDVCVCSFLCLKLYSLNFAIAHGQKRFLCLSEFLILVLHKYLGLNKQGSSSDKAYIFPS